MNVERLTLRWVGVYTRGLPPPARQARQDEIASDLWEHRVATGSGAAADLRIISRALRGVGSDLSWRHAQRRGGHRAVVRPALRAFGWAAATTSYLLVVSIHTWGATALVGLDVYGEDWAPGDVTLYSRISGVLLALLVGGTLLVRRYPLPGAMLVVIALVAQAVIFWWAAPITLSLGVAIATGTVVVARRCAAARQLRASSAAS